MDAPTFKPVPLDRDLPSWNEKWSLEGDRDEYLECRLCRISQPPAQADKPFRHLAGCPNAGEFAQFPWKDLAWILVHTSLNR